MPSWQHEELRELVRLAPGVRLERLRAAYPLPLPPFATFEVRGGT